MCNSPPPVNLSPHVEAHARALLFFTRFRCPGWGRMDRAARLRAMAIELARTVGEAIDLPTARRVFRVAAAGL